MPANRVAYIIIASIIALFLIHKCSEMPQRESARTGTAQEAGDGVSGDEKTGQPGQPGQYGQPGQPGHPGQEDAQKEKPFVLRTPTPELVEVRPPAVNVKEEADALTHKPVPVLESVGEGPAGVKLEMASADGALQKASTTAMVLVQEGCFIMGSHEDDAFEGETPWHEVCLMGFYLDMKEVTQEAFSEMIGSNPSRFEGKGLSVESVSWFEASRYCSLLGKRLPTEAEWEYAAHARGLDTIWSGTSVLSRLESYAWIRSNSNEGTHEPGLLKPNAIGLYDMSGNVREWVADWYNEHYYAKSPVNDPAGPQLGVDKVLRGGSWDDLPRYNRVSYRVRLDPEFSNSRNGFRCALDVEGSVR